MSCPVCLSNCGVNIGSKNGYELVSCGKCGLVFVDPAPEVAQIEALYDGFQKTGAYLRKLKKKEFTSVLKLARLRRYLTADRSTFLDVGCSVGATVGAARRLGYQATGIDLDRNALEHATRLFPDCEFLPMTSIELARQGRQFGLVYCAEVIEHVADPHEFLSSLIPLLKPQSILYLTTPDAAHRTVPRDFLSWKRVTPPEHIRYYARKSMTRLLESHGIEVVKFLWSHRSALRVIGRKA